MAYGLNENPEYGSTPSLRVDPTIGGRSGRYPNQFFDLAQQYMPPTMSELLKWCTFYYYNSPLIGAAITKISRYPITDFIFEDEHESIRDKWDSILNKKLNFKNTLMEINLDYHVYGNAFISTFMPFTRFLICRTCKARHQIHQADWSFNSSTYEFSVKCTCGVSGSADVKDVPYKDIDGFKVIRWNPENIRIKCNEYTGRKIYMYIVPYKLKNAIMRGDKDIIEDMPMLVMEAIKNRRMIRFNNKNFKHIKRPTLAEQDQGWGKPIIIHVLKDMYYLYTLRRAQEAIAMEHIVPFDIIYPMPNAQQDPYIHMDLANWKNQIESIIMKHRRDPNFKGVIPVPVGFGRLGGDGKAMLLTPELNMLNQQIISGMGIQSELLFGGLSWTGSSVSLRMLENDFIQNRSQLLDVSLWVKDKLRLWLSVPDLKGLRFSDFRMADDVQRNQQLIGLNASRKISDQTLLAELNYNYDQEIKKMIEESYVQNYLNDLMSKGQAKTQGETMLINQQYQNKLQKIIQAAGGQPAWSMQQGGQPQEGGQQVDNQGGQQVDNQGALPPPEQGGQPQQGQGAQAAPQAQGELQAGVPPEQQGAQQGGDVESRVSSWASKLVNLPPNEAQGALNELKMKFPDIGRAVEKEYTAKLSGADMSPMPVKGAPRRAGAV